MLFDAAPLMQARKWGDEVKTASQLDFSKYSGAESDASGYQSGGGYTSETRGDAVDNPNGSAAPHSRMDVLEEVTYDDDDREIAAQLEGSKKGGGLLAGFLSSIQVQCRPVPLCSR